jgi:nucleoside-diphosphate-sugar epimerase
VIGGTGPTGPFIVNGLRARGYETTILHTGRHEVDDIPADVEHIHASPHDAEAFAAAIGSREFDVTLAMYGRLRAIAEIMVDRTGQFISIGGVPAYRGYMDPDLWSPPGLPLPTREDAPLADESADGKSYRVARTERIMFGLHPQATHFRYPIVYGPRQPAPREWSIVRRVLDQRRHIVVADGGLTLLSCGYVENLAYAVLLAVGHPAAAGQCFNVADDECLTLAQVIEIVAHELDHEIEIVSLPWEIALPARPLVAQHRPTHRVLDTSSLRERLGYRDIVPARIAIARTARWLAQHPPEPGGVEEMVLDDPFDYDAEDQLIGAWKSALSALPSVEWRHTPGFGLTYSGPGASRVRSDTRI